MMSLKFYTCSIVLFWISAMLIILRAKLNKISIKKSKESKLFKQIQLVLLGLLPYINVFFICWFLYCGLIMEFEKFKDIMES